MGRRSDHSREELVTLAVEAARAIMVEEGVAQVSARAIAKRIGYSPGTLYNLFENIDAIVYQVNAGTLRALAAFAMTALADKTDPLERAVALGRAYVDYAAEHPQPWLAVFDFRPAPDSKPPPLFEEAVALLFAVVADCLTPYFAAGEERLRDAAGRVLWSGVHGISLLHVTARLNQPEGMTAADMAELLIRNFLRGLKTQPD
ncbi:TetR/AcrR family transcriptional regulator [Pelagibius sp.]|uniref:TetR/AcrR family transcriptional regulator n=1 Tax=Pelagibius sp. TaxID=1931238 RepID=UPI002634B428|nr:TetR/AcrR family transcriptional regulator [Pelagibius sp.]